MIRRKTRQVKPETQNASASGWLMSLALSASVIAAPAMATETITLIEMGDLHGTLVPHAAMMKNPDGSEYEAPSAGGLARLKTVVNEIRADNPEAFLLSAGDLTHGSAETLFTVGDAMMIPINAFGIDVYTPGNWDFGYGAAVFRNRFTEIGPGSPKPTIPGNIRTMSGYVGCDGIPEIAGLTDTASGYTCKEFTMANLPPAFTPDPGRQGCYQGKLPDRRPQPL